MARRVSHDCRTFGPDCPSAGARQFFVKDGQVSIIYDGLTREAYIAAVPRLHDELRFKFRPPTKESIGRFFDGAKKQSMVAAAQYEATGIAARLVSWSLLDAEGNTILPAAKTVAVLQPKLFDRIRDIVLYGSEGGDADPSEDATELADDTADAVEQGLSIATLREGNAIKN